jgi:hypothetical protein
MSNTEMRIIDLAPDWQGVFRFAVQLCRDSMSEDDGSALVIEMLEFGATLEAARAVEATMEAA